MKKTLLLISAALLAFPMFASAQGIVGECADCHTMHNSEQGQPVALQGFSTTPSFTPNQNLLKFDCIACHAQDAGGAANIVGLTGGSQVPQVMHTAGPGNDLAAGNFQHIATGGNRKGHNVQDLLLPASTDNPNAKGVAEGTPYAVPPGQYYGYQDGHGKHLSSSLAAGFDKFTCAGAGGCHGTRSQLVVTAENYVCLEVDTEPGGVCEGMTLPATLPTGSAMARTGMAAITGAHHESYDGAKTPAQVAAGVHDGAYTASSYRFLNGVQGYGNEAARWQNVDSDSHNEYFGAQALAWTAGCNSCHVTGTDVNILEYAGPGFNSSSRMTADSSLKAPNQSMSGFCTTCHGNFHSTSLETSGNYDRGPANGVSGAFLRHPSDYVIPMSGEYQYYTVYNTTAPVARPTVATAASAVVTPDTDMVMCLSCHQAHATQHDGMLRFDYSTMVSGSFATTELAQAAGGCMACHTTKGVAK